METFTLVRSDSPRKPKWAQPDLAGRNRCGSNGLGDDPDTRHRDNIRHFRHTFAARSRRDAEWEREIR